ncbi:sensor domain-containing diguanylate cyclase [Halanaerobium praevalens]|uniref:Diguanylate cyclase with PAS/PAC sensor n=1 Tax=Halanaerobium praevalens (strain ATCC 33744 / DSM 2228 / GSL) TaxID=572479 RepID=E3DRV8_HALPG|nr:sensor domain-containing diguanylate cyclase [Halanaerobium praevalens]ADO78172.1 diguanylate cyclase with PAS/PAC sensor [Halanaerobium praevalens DSM 2228]
MQNNYLQNELYNLVQNDNSIFEFIQSGSLDGIWYWDLENPEQEWMSPKFWQTLGYDPEQKKHLASEWQDIIFKEDLKLASENFEKHCADPNHPYDQIVRYRHKNGSTVWIRCRGLAIRDQNGQAIRMLGAHTDITDLKLAEKEVSRLKEEYQKVFNGTQDAMFLIKVGPEGKFHYLRNNLAHQNKTGIALAEIQNKTPRELFGAEQGKKISSNYQKAVLAAKSITYEEELNLPAGKRIWLTSLTPVIKEQKVTHLVGSSKDITARKKLELQLEKQANYDNLTGLVNRKLFFEILAETIKNQQENDNKFSLIFLDLDHFKAINDNYGHDVGDDVLITVGQRLLNAVRQSDTVARMGGDEFTIILRNLAAKKDAQKIIEKIHKSLKEVIKLKGKEYQIGSSIGAVIYPEDGQAIEDLMRKADLTMYEVKNKNKGCFKFFEKEAETEK